MRGSGLNSFRLGTGISGGLGVTSLVNLRVLQSAGNIWTSYVFFGFSRISVREIGIAVKNTSATFCDLTQRRFVILYSRFGKTYRPHLRGSSCPAWTLKMGSRGYSETLHKIPEERRPHLNRDGSLKSRSGLNHHFHSLLIQHPCF